MTAFAALPGINFLAFRGISRGRLHSCRGGTFGKALHELHKRGKVFFLKIGEARHIRPGNAFPDYAGNGGVVRAMYFIGGGQIGTAPAFPGEPVAKRAVRTVGRFAALNGVGGGGRADVGLLRQQACGRQQRINQQRINQ